MSDSPNGNDPTITPNLEAEDHTSEPTPFYGGESTTEKSGTAPLPNLEEEEQRTRDFIARITESAARSLREIQDDTAALHADAARMGEAVDEAVDQERRRLDEEEVRAAVRKGQRVRGPLLPRCIAPVCLAVLGLFTVVSAMVTVPTNVTALVGTLSTTSGAALLWMGGRDGQ